MEGINNLQNLIRHQSFLDALEIPGQDKIQLTPLAQGEYHKNYTFIHPVSGKKLVLRVNYGSQLHLEKQVTYEYHALQLLELSGRTPHPYYVDDTKTIIPQGILVMDYLEGRPLSYDSDMDGAACCLADIHSTKIDAKSNTLLPVDNPIYAILDECEHMLDKYRNSHYKDDKVLKYIERLMKMAYKRAETITDSEYQNVCINTELNNHNFIVNDQTKAVSLIDWEKPLYGDMAQDLGHMLAPTTTFWRTDRVLSGQEINHFIDHYIKAVDGRVLLGDIEKRAHIFLQVTCLRGLTWCAMAWDEYQNPERGIRNEQTYSKLKAYLKLDFLEYIESVIK